MGFRADLMPLVRNHNFLKLWAAQVISSIGDRLAQMALLGLISGAAAQTLNDLVQLTLFAAVPGILVSPFGAMILDRVHRKHILVLSDALRGVLVIAIPFAHGGPYGMVVVNAIVFVTAMSGSLHGLTQSVVIPQVVGRQNLLMANSLASATGLISTLIGFALVGVLVSRLPTKVNFLIDAMIYGASAAFVALLTIQRVAPKTKLGVRQVLDDLRTGLRLSFTDGTVRSLVFLSACFWAIAGFVYVSVFALSMKELGFETNRDADMFGVMMSCLGVGLVAGAFATSRLKQVAHYPHMPYFVLVPLGLSIGMWAFATDWWRTAHVALGQTPVLAWLPQRFVPTLVPSLGLIVVGVLGSAFLLPVDTGVQRQVRDELLGRIQGARGIISGCGFCSAVMLAGWLTQRYDASEIILGFGIGVAVLASGWILISRVLRYQFARFLLNLVMKALFRLKVEGLEHVPLDQPVVFAVNRASLLDIPTMAAATPRRLYFFINRETFNLRPWHRLFRGLGFIPLDPGGTRVAAVRRAIKILERGKNLVVFPERDWPRDGRVAAFHEGASLIAGQAGVSLVPVALQGLREVLPHGARRIRFSRIRVRFGDPIPPEKHAELGRKELTAELRRRISALLGNADDEIPPPNTASTMDT